MESSAILAEIPSLRRYARALLGDRAAADDLVQDTLERAWQRLSQWRTGSDLRAWMFSIMHNLRIDQMRRPDLPTQSVEDDDFELPTRARQTDGLELRDLESALDCLPGEQREVLLLVGLEDMSYAQIAAATGVPVGTVMSRLARGRERLRMIMRGEPPTARLRIVR